MFAAFGIICITFAIANAQNPCSCSQLKQCVQGRQSQRNQVINRCMTKCDPLLNGLRNRGQLTQCFNNFLDFMKRIEQEGTQCVFEQNANQVCSGGGRNGRSKRMPSDKKDDSSEQYRPHSANPYINAYYACMMGCVDEESEKQDLYGGYPNNMVGGRRKRSAEMMGKDTQYCAVQANCDINMITHMKVTKNCGERLNMEQQFEDQIQQICQCIQRTLGKSANDYPCEPNMMG